jgi:hypothetical protein
MKGEENDEADPEGPYQGRQGMQVRCIGVEPAEIDRRIPEDVEDDEQEDQLACRGHDQFSAD